MKTLTAIALATLCGCATSQPRETYHTEPLTIILDTEEGINKSYQLFTLGKRPKDRVSGFQVNNQIYCTRGDYYTLGHELTHIIKGKFHGERKQLRHWGEEQ